MGVEVQVCFEWLCGVKMTSVGVRAFVCVWICFVLFLLFYRVCKVDKKGRYVDVSPLISCSSSASFSVGKRGREGVTLIQFFFSLHMILVGIGRGGFNHFSPGICSVGAVSLPQDVLIN